MRVLNNIAGHYLADGLWGLHDALGGVDGHSLRGHVVNGLNLVHRLLYEGIIAVGHVYGLRLHWRLVHHINLWDLILLPE